MSRPGPEEARSGCGGGWRGGQASRRFPAERLGAAGAGAGDSAAGLGLSPPQGGGRLPVPGLSGGEVWAAAGRGTAGMD